MQVRLPLLLLGLVGCPALSDADLNQRFDRDGDGFKARAFDGLDCDDNDATVHPDAVEICDGVDNDCDDLVNADDPDMPDAEVLWALDADRDGFGSDDIAERSCKVLAGHVHERGDCDDTDPDAFPGQTWFLDGDADGWGLAARPRVECARPDAHSLVPGDCDDANDQIFPEAPERCNSGIDDDCDLSADVGDDNVVDAALVYADLDDDDFGDDATAVLTCPGPDDVTVGGDCNDDDRSINPGALDPPYTGGDTNCSGDSDWDDDGDGHDIVGGATAGDDCDDTRSWVHPGAPEVCDDAPNDCTDPGVWDESLEGQQVTFVPSVLSPPIDWTPTLTSGGTVQIAEDGTLFLCDQPAAGPWSGSVEVTGGDVTIRAARGPGTSTLQAGGLLTANVTATGASTILRLEDLTLELGEGVPTGLTTTGGCVWADAVSSVALDNVTLRNCSATVGGGAALGAGSVTVAGSLVEDNAADFGAGLYVQVTGAATIVGSTFTGNDAIDGGGLHVAEFVGAVPTASIVGSTFTKNTATLGGGLYTEIDTTLSGTVFTDNTGTTGGGMYVRGLQGADVTCESGTAFLRNSTFAIALQRGTLVADTCDFAFSGVDDNTTADIWTAMFGFVYSFEGPSTVLCSSQSGCL
jgi:hypothetical protein